MSDRERELAIALGKCRFPGACFSKRFAATMKARAEQVGTLTERQATRLEVQAYIYRRQIPAHLIPASPPPGYQTPKQRNATSPK
jgi:hypothetical protein